ncbi:MAG: hypothetical protein ACLFQL_04395 [Paracoccaceae bacterium]
MLKVLVLVCPFLLASCAQAVWAPDEAVARAEYRHPGPPALTLYTMVNNRTGQGAHTSLMINASQRVIFDPAGSVEHPAIPERNDVLFGITPGFAEAYRRAHARETHHVLIQRKEVPAEVAELALRKVMANGPVPAAQCAIATSRILSGLPGFESVEQSWYPLRLSESFARLPGVTEEKLVEYDDPDKAKAIRDYRPRRSSGEVSLSVSE